MADLLSWHTFKPFSNSVVQSATWNQTGFTISKQKFENGLDLWLVRKKKTYLLHLSSFFNVFFETKNSTIRFDHERNLPL